MKIRIDKLLLDRGLAPSRERAQAMILAGRVLVNDQKITKAGTSVAEDAVVRLLGDDLRYVSRGGIKLEAALRHWHVDLNNKTCMDVGASTGGFTDCMLQHGAAQVIAVDTGYGQIDAKFRDHPQVRLMEKTNARFLAPQNVPERVQFVAMDVSFISATLVLPSVVDAAFKGEPGEIVLLVKPQFEVGRERVGKGGIVRDEAAQQNAVVKVRECLSTLGASEIDGIESPITGAEGNREFLLHAFIGPK